MTQQVLDQPLPPQAPNEADLVAAIQRILGASAEPLTPSKIRAHLPANFRAITLEQLIDCLDRRVGANVLYQYDPYRSQQHRYWDRPPTVHLIALVRSGLEEGPLGWSQLRRKLPHYARERAEEILKSQVDQGLLFLHPKAGSRTGPRYGLQAPNPREPLREELLRLFDRLQREFGFSRSQLREGALELLHEEEWDVQRTPEPAAAPEPPVHEHITPHSPGHEHTAHAPTASMEAPHASPPGEPHP